MLEKLLVYSLKISSLFFFLKKREEEFETDLVHMWRFQLSLCFSPVADAFFQLCGPGADLLVIVCLKYQTTSINLQRQRCFQIQMQQMAAIHAVHTVTAYLALDICHLKGSSPFFL